MAAPASQPLQGASTPANHAAPNLRAMLALIAGIVLISFNGIWVTLANTSGPVAGFYRLTIASALLTIPVAINWRRGVMKLPRAGLALALIAGVAVAGDLGTWNTAVLLIGPGMAALLGNTAPLWVSLGAWLIFKNRLRPLYWAGLGVALLGAIFIVGDDALSEAGIGPGYVLGLLTGVCYAAYQLITHRARALVDNLSYMWVYSAVGALALLIVSLALGHPITGLSAQTYGYLVVMAVVSHLGGWLLVNYAFGHLPVAVVTVTLLIQPVVTLFLQLALLPDAPMPTVWQIGAGVVVLAGIYLVHLSSSANRDAAEADAEVV